MEKGLDASLPEVHIQANLVLQHSPQNRRHVVDVLEKLIQEAPGLLGLELLLVLARMDAINRAHVHTRPAADAAIDIDVRILALGAIEGETLRPIGRGNFALGARAGQIAERLDHLATAGTPDMLAIQLDDEAMFLDCAASRCPYSSQRSSSKGLIEI